MIARSYRGRCSGEVFLEVEDSRPSLRARGTRVAPSIGVGTPRGLRDAERVFQRNGVELLLLFGQEVVL